MTLDPMTDPVRPTRFLTVTGVLIPDGRLVLQPGFVTEDPALANDAPDSPLVAEFQDSGERVILRVGVPVAPFLVEPAARAVEADLVEGPDAGNLAVAGKLPYPEATRLIRFLLRDVPIHELQVSELGPELDVGWELPREPTGRHRVGWSSTHSEGRDISYTLAYSNDGGATWQPLLLPSPATEFEVDFDSLPGGRARLRLLATDGTATATSDSPVLRVARKPCIPAILEPIDGAKVAAGEPVVLSGQGWYLEERRVEHENLTWTSSLDGLLGRGAAIQSELKAGTHKITLEAGTPARRAATTITILAVAPEQPMGAHLDRR